MTRAQQARFVVWLKRRGIGFPFRLARAAHRASLDPAAAAVLIIKETGGRNVFGCDYGDTDGRAPWCHEPVTALRVDQLRVSGKRNGIGPAQLTADAWVTQRPSTWGTVHRPGVNMEAAFRGFKALVKDHGIHGAALRYNGAESYADDFDRRYKGVRRSLKGAKVIA